MGEGQDTEVAVGLEPVWGRGLNDLVPEKARDVVQLEPDEADPPVVRRVPVVHCQPQAGPRGWGKQPVCASGVFHFQLNIYRQKKNVGRNRAHGGYLSYPCPYPPPFIFHQIGFDGRIVGPHSSMLKSLQRLLWTGEKSAVWNKHKSIFGGGKREIHNFRKPSGETCGSKNVQKSW